MKRTKDTRTIAGVAKDGKAVPVWYAKGESIKPPRVIKEYHGNGKSAWYGSEYHILLSDGSVVKVEQRSHRYSYRWHSTKVRIDGRKPNRWDYYWLDQLYANTMKEQNNA